MKPHKHSELIKAWADGAEIEYKSKLLGTWHLFDGNRDAWVGDYEFRIKPEPEPDRYKSYLAFEGHIYEEGDRHPFPSGCVYPNLQLTFDGETGRLKSAEVLK
jgi:hypothetical protein